MLLVFACLLWKEIVYAVDVKTAKDLIDLFENTKGNVLEVNLTLLNDIDFSLTQTPPLGAFSDGKCVSYSGTFQGNGYSIKGLVMNNVDKQEYKHAGLFCNLKDAKIENLTIDSSCNFTGKWSGGLSVTASGSLDVKTVTNNAYVNGSEWAGGFIAYIKELEKEKVFVNFENCTNNGSIIIWNKQGDEHGAGGFVGHIWGDHGMRVSFINSINNGQVTGNNNDDGALYIGGFAGEVQTNGEDRRKEWSRTDSQHERINVIMNKCTNNAYINGIKSLYSGGFIGGTWYKIKLSFMQCINKGIVDGPTASGFLSNSLGANGISFSNCINDGDIRGSSQDGNLGGFVAYLYDSENGLYISNCTNNGNIIGNCSRIAGGFVGICFSDFQAFDSINNGSVSAISGGGFIGFVSLGNTNSEDMELQMNNCQNYGNFDSCSFSELAYIGGFVGETKLIKPHGRVFIENCAEAGNIKSVTGTGSVGGMIGKVGFDYDPREYQSKDETINNQVTITSSAIHQNLAIECQECAVGGTIGTITSGYPYQTTVVSVSIIGIQDINVKCDDCIVGGILGTIIDTVHASITITDTIINGSLDVEHDNMNHSATGGFIGSATNNSGLILSISDSTNNLTISTKRVDQVGGIIGTYSNSKNIIGGATLYLNNVKNNGCITSNESLIVGGIIGFIFNIESVSVTGCSNYGNLTINCTGKTVLLVE